MASDQDDAALVDAVAAAINESGMEFLEQHPNGGYAEWFDARCKAAIRVVRDALSADLAARVEAERVACQVVAAKEEDAAADWIALADGYGGPRSPEYAVKKAEQHTARRVKLAIRALGPTPAYDAAIQAAREDGMEAAVRIARRFGSKCRAHRTVAKVAGKHLHAQLWDASADAASDIEEAIRAAKDQPA